MLIKQATTTIENVRAVTAEIALGSEENMAYFKKLAADVKRVAPKSDEFVYFVCRAIHAMEAANYDPVTKTFNGDGYIIRRGEDGKDQHGRKVEDWQDGLWYSESGVEPYVNQNGDAFPEEELLSDVEIVDENGDPKTVKSYQTFVGRGLFVNHASDDAEKIRGIVLDARWDPGTKGVDILVACDKIGYPELARQIEAGYSNDVSMGTQVQYSLCSECGNKAVTEDDYCEHVKGSKGLQRAGANKVYEINNGLNFIEISVVSNGADPKAKIRSIVAMLQDRVNEREASLKACINQIEAEKIRDELRTVKAELNALTEVLEKEEIKRTASDCGCQSDGECSCGGSCSCGSNITDAEKEQLLGTALSTPEGTEVLKETLMQSTQEARRKMRLKIAQELNLTLPSDEEDVTSHIEEDNVNIINGGNQMVNQRKKAYFLGAGGLNDPSVTPYDKEDYTTYRDQLDKHMVGQGMEEGNDGLHSGYDSYPVKPELRWKEELLRASTREQRRKIRRAILREAATEREAYFLGGGGLNDPSATPYDKEDYASIRDNEDKQMVGQGMEPGNEGLHPGYDSFPTKPEMRWKEELLRAKLRARFVTANSREKSYWTVYAGDKPILQATAEELYPGDLDEVNDDNPDISNWDWVASEEYGKNIIKAIKQDGFAEIKAQIERAKVLSKTAQDAGGLDNLGDLGGPSGDLGMGMEDELGDEGLDMPEEGGEEELDSREQINSALGQIEDAVREIRALNEGEEADVDSLETELDLGEAGAELEGLDQELGQAAASGNAKLFKDLMILTKQALKDANGLVRKAHSLLGKPYSPRIVKVAEDGKADIEQAKGDLEEAKEELNKGDADQAKKEVEEAEHELEEVKAGDKTASARRLLERKLARYKVAQELYNITDSDMINEAHPDGGTATKAGEEDLEGDNVVETEIEQQEADMDVAEKQPRGELTARQIRRRKLVLAMKCPECGHVDCGCGCDPETGEGCDCHKEEADLDVAGLEVIAKHCPECDCDPCECPDMEKEAKKDKDDDKKAKKGEKPDFADIDDDGNEEESAKEAADDKEDKDDDDDNGDKKDAASRRQLRRKALKGLKSEAEVDAETKSYWSELFAESSTGNPADPECKGYAGELTSDYYNQKTTASAHNFKVRMKRAFKVAMKQQAMGQIEDNQEALEEQVDRLMNMDTDGFEAFEDVIENTIPTKDAKVQRPMKRTAGALRVGVLEPGIDDLTSRLSKLDWS